MKVLATNYRVLQCLCICPFEETIDWSRKSLNISLISIIFIAEIGLVIASIAFFNANIADNLEESLYACAQISCFFMIPYLITLGFVFRYKITEMFNNLSRIYEESENNNVKNRSML